MTSRKAPAKSRLSTWSERRLFVVVVARGANKSLYAGSCEEVFDKYLGSNSESKQSMESFMNANVVFTGRFCYSVP